MSKELADRLIKLLKEGLSLGGQVSQADFDEIEILHARAKDFFPNEFNILMDSSRYSSISRMNAETFDRLLRILKVIGTLPEELQRPPSLTENLPSTALIPMFELGKHDKARIFELCSDMRKIVFASQNFDEPHRLRLLNRIAAIEAETHKPKGMFDVARGLVNDWGETIGKFGKDIKPMTDRVTELVGIARKGTKEYDQLPVPDEVKRLPAPSTDDPDESGTA